MMTVELLPADQHVREMELIESVMSLDRFAENPCIHVAWSTVIA